MLKQPEILILAETPKDAGFLVSELQKNGFIPVFKRVGTPASFIKSLALRQWDILLCYHPPEDFNYLSAMKILRRKRNHTPFIFIYEEIDAPQALKAIARGANELIRKRDIYKLIPLIRHILTKTAVRLRRDDDLQRIARALKVHTLCNKTIVTATNEYSMLKEICRNIVESGGYRMAWVGYKVYDKNRSIVPIAQWGYERGYLHKLKISWANTKKGRGPSGTAIRTGKTVVCQNIPTDENLKPWRRESVKCGFASTIALPLVFHKKVIGMVSIYAAEPEAFNQDEVRLLQELSRDITFGITALWDRKVRQKAQQEIIDLNKNLETRVKERTAELRAEIAQRREMEQALGKSEKKYRELFESSRDGIVLVDLKKSVLDANQAYLDMIGYSREEIKNITYAQRAPAASRQIGNRIIKDQLSVRGYSDRYERELIKKDGSVIPISLKTWVLKSKDGRPLGYWAIIRDITGQKKFEAALAKSEKKYRELFESSRDGIILTNLDGYILEANQEFLNMTGYSYKEVCRVSYEQRTPAESRAIEENIFRNQVLTRGYSEGYEKELIRKNGTTIPVSVRMWLTKDEQGNPLGVWTVLRDIADQKRTQEIIKQREAMLRSTFSAVPAGISLATNRIITYINDQFRQICGYPPAELIGKNTRFLYLSNAEYQRVGQALYADLRHKGQTSVETHWRRKDGVIIDILINCAQLDQNNPAAGEILSFLDITERKRAEKQIQELNEDLKGKIAQLEAANKDLESFSYSVSHDLRAPLRTIHSFAQILTEDYSKNLEGESLHLLTRIHDNAIRMNQLINGLLNFAHLGKKEIKLSGIDMKRQAKSVIKELDPAAGGRKIKFIIGRLPPAYGDQTLMRQVWLNLLSNSVKYTATRNSPRIEIGHVKNRDENVYYIKDNGVGFDMQFVHKLFNAFQRLHRSNEFEGIGIGLAIVKRIVQRFNGRVWAEGKVNEGATFYFALPARPNKRIHSPERAVPQ